MQTPYDPRELFTGRDELRNFAKTSIYVAYDPDVSANQIITEMREMGLSYRRQDMLEDIRFSRGLEKYESKFQTYDRDGIVPKAWQQEVPYSLSQEGQYRFRITVFDEETGELRTISRAMATGNWYTKGEAEEIMAGHMVGALQEYGLRTIGVDLYEVWNKVGGELLR